MDSSRFSKLGAIAHASENLLGRLRDGELLLDEEITSALLESVDAIREILANIERTGQEGDRDNRALNDKLTRLLQKEQDFRRRLNRSPKSRWKPKIATPSAKSPKFRAPSKFRSRLTIRLSPRRNHRRSRNPRRRSRQRST